MVEIVYAHHDSEVTGSTISLRNLLAELDRRLFSPRLALFSDGPARELFETLNIPVDIVKARPFWTSPGNPWTKLGFYYNFLALLPNKNWSQYLRQRRPDLVHVNDKACLQAGSAARKLGAPVVWHLRSSYTPSFSRLQAKISANVIRRNATAMIAISEDETDGFEDFPGLSIVHNSLDLAAANHGLQRSVAIRSELGIRIDEIVVGLVVTQLNWVRGAWDFLDLAGQLTAMVHKPIKFVIVGRTTNESAAQARALAHQHGVLDRLVLTGFRSDALAVMAAMDVLVVCNHHGVLGRPPLEAMAVGTPVVAWHGHSCRSSILKHGETGLLAPTGNVTALAQLTTSLVEDADLRTKMKQRAMSYAREQFDPQCNARKVERIYDTILIRKNEYVTRIDG